MHRMMTGAGLIGTLMLLMSACSEVPTEPATELELQAATVTTTTWVEDMAGTVYQLECEPGVKGEPVALSGQIVYRFSVVLDGTGGVHISSTGRPQGLSGVGLDSGEEYRVAEHSHESWTTSSVVSNGAYRTTLTMTGRESRQRFTVVISGHYVMNANGELVVFDSQFEVQCR
jgi:hypothetical protein